MNKIGIIADQKRLDRIHGLIKYLKTHAIVRIIKSEDAILKFDDLLEQFLDLDIVFTRTKNHSGLALTNAAEDAGVITINSSEAIILSSCRFLNNVRLRNGGIRVPDFAIAEQPDNIYLPNKHCLKSFMDLTRISRTKNDVTRGSTIIKGSMGHEMVGEMGQIVVGEMGQIMVGEMGQIMVGEVSGGVNESINGREISINELEKNMDDGSIILHDLANQYENQNEFSYLGSLVFAQEYIRSEWEYKVFRIGDRLFFYKQRPTLFYPNKHTTRKQIEPTEELKDVAMKASNIVGLELCSIDFLGTPGNLYLTDINSTPGFGNIEDSGKNVDKILGDFLLERIG